MKSKKPAVTPWFGGDVKPARRGWYQRTNRNRIAFWFFDGEYWRYGGFTRPSMQLVENSYSMHQHLPWRGLAEKP